MIFKIGDKVKYIGKNSPSLYINTVGTYTVSVSVPEFLQLREINKFHAYKQQDFRLVEEKINGSELIQKLFESKIENCEIKVYKSNKYLFNLKVQNSHILDNPNFHIGMLTSKKYTYEIENIKEMTQEEIEKELGYKFKLKEI